MIILITGQPGSGKTAHAVDLLAHDAQFEGRPKFVMGVPDLAIDHSEVPPIDQWTEKRPLAEDPSVELPYFTFPENSVIFLDEAQRIYRPRPVGSAVPPHVAAFETHRHTGVDFILITQQAGLIDSNIRKLIGRHIHIRVTPFGRYRYEWTELGDPESTTSRQLAAKTKYHLPKRAFQLYRSSQLHTKIKTSIPFYVYLFGVASLAAIALGYYGYQRIVNKATDPEPLKTSQTAPAAHKADKDAPKTADDLIAESVPRIAGLLHTAPKYDELTKPTETPWPAGCYKTKKSCKCVTQQGTHYDTTQTICEQIIAKGIFKDFGTKDEARIGASEARTATNAPESQAPSFITLGNIPAPAASFESTLATPPVQVPATSPNRFPALPS